MELQNYQTPAGSCPLEEYLNSLNEKTRKKVFRNLERLEREGFSLLRTSDIFSKITGYQDLSELKIKFNKMEHRVICGKTKMGLYTLDGFSKKEGKLKQKDITRSLNRLEELKSRNI